MDARVRDPGLITLSPVSYEVDQSSNGFGSNANLDTSFELMSASQLRNQLRVSNEHLHETFLYLQKIVMTLHVL